MVKSICKIECAPQGATQSVAAHWLHSRKEGGFPNLIVVRTTELSVYSVKSTSPDDSKAQSADERQNKRPASRTLELEYSTHLNGDVLAIACLPARRHTFRDSVILMFESGQVTVLAWDVCKLRPIPTSLHMFSPHQLPKMSRSMVTRPPVIDIEPTARCAAILLHQSCLAVLPAVTPGVKQQVTCMQSAAAVGNSFVIDLSTHGIRNAQDFTFLHGADAVVLVLYEIHQTWAGSLHRKKDTCAVKALAITAAGKTQPVMWSAQRLPSDSFAVTAVPNGGAIILSPALLIYQNKSSRISIATGSAAVPGVVPDVPDVASMENQELAAIQAVELAEKFATNVAPSVVPEAAGRARVAELPADLSLSRLQFLSSQVALLALSSGLLLQLSLQREAGGRVCGITMKAVGNASPPSCICALGSSLIFIGSWLGHSNVVSYKFEDPDVIAQGEKDKEKENEKENHKSQSLVDALGVNATNQNQEPQQQQPEATPVAAQPVQLAQPTDISPSDISGAAAAEAVAVVTPAPLRTSEASPSPSMSLMSAGALAAGSSDLGALVEQMKAEPSVPAINTSAPLVATQSTSEQTDALLQTHQAAPGAAVDTAVPQERSKRSFGSIDGPLDPDPNAQDSEGSPASKLPRIDEALTDIVLAIEASSPKATSPTASTPAAGLPFGPRGGTLVPGLGGGAVPGLGMISSAAAVREEHSTLTQGPEAPLEEENPSASSDDDNLEASLYHAPVGDSHFGRLDAGMLVLRGEDRLPQLGPITAFAMGTPAQCGTTSKGDSITRGGNQLLACVGHGRSGALAVVQGAINPQQDGAVDFQALGQCTGVWGLGASSGGSAEDHTYMIISFQESTFVYDFGQQGTELKIVSDDPACQFAVDCETVYACTMFDGHANVQVCAHTVHVVKQITCTSKWHLSAVAASDMIIAATHAHHYLLLRLKSHRAVLLTANTASTGSSSSSSSFALQELQGSGALLNPKPPAEAHIAACCLYHDVSGWLASALQTSENEQATTHGTFLVLCRSSGSLEVYTLPGLKPVAQFKAMHEGEATVPAEEPARANATSGGAAPAEQIVEMRMDSFAQHSEASHHPLGAVPAPEVLCAERPLLLLRAADERIFLYRMQLHTATDNPGDAQQRICLCRQPFDWLRRCPSGSPKACGNPHTLMTRFTNIGVEFSTSSSPAVAVHQGIFICGEQPVWLLAHRGGYRVHMMGTLEHSSSPPTRTGVAAMAGWHTPKAPRSFVVVSAKTSELRFCHMAKNVRIHMPSPTQYKGLSISDKDKKRHEGITPHKVTWHPTSKLFFVATSRRMPFIPHLPPEPTAQDDPHAAFAYKLSETVARSQSGEVRYQIRGVTADTLTTACDIKLKPLETILCLESVKLIPEQASDATEKATSELFLAAGIGCLVTEDWSSQGSVQLYRVSKERTQAFDGTFVDKWTVASVYRREFAGPVTAINSSFGRLVLAFGHNVEVYKWTGTNLELCSPLVNGNPRLITSLAVMANRFMLVGNMQKGMLFLEIREDKGMIKLLSRDFGRADACSVEFLLENKSLGFVHADASGHIAVFMYQRIGSTYEPPGIKAHPVGRFYVGHKIAALRRGACLTDVNESSSYQAGASGRQPPAHGVVFCSSSGALGWIIPVSSSDKTDNQHKVLAALCSKLHTSLEHVAGLNPRTFRARTSQQAHVYGNPAPLDGVLDFEILHQFCMLPRTEQKEVARKYGVNDKTVVRMLCQLQASAAFF